MSDSATSTDAPHGRVRVLFLIDTSVSMAEGRRLEAIDRFFAGMRSGRAGSAQAELAARIDIQAIWFSDLAAWHVRLPTPLAALGWPPLPLGGGTILGAALTLAATSFNPSDSLSERGDV